MSVLKGEQLSGSQQQLASYSSTSSSYLGAFLYDPSSPLASFSSDTSLFATLFNRPLQAHQPRKKRLNSVAVCIYNHLYDQKHRASEHTTSNTSLPVVQHLDERKQPQPQQQPPQQQQQQQRHPNRIPPLLYRKRKPSKLKSIAETASSSNQTTTTMVAADSTRSCSSSIAYSPSLSLSPSSFTSSSLSSSSSSTTSGGPQTPKTTPPPPLSPLPASFARKQAAIKQVRFKSCGLYKSVTSDHDQTSTTITNSSENNSTRTLVASSPVHEMRPQMCADELDELETLNVEATEEIVPKSASLSSSSPSSSSSLSINLEREVVVVGASTSVLPENDNRWPSSSASSHCVNDRDRDTAPEHRHSTSISSFESYQQTFMPVNCTYIALSVLSRLVSFISFLNKDLKFKYTYSNGYIATITRTNNHQIVESSQAADPIEEETSGLVDNSTTTKRRRISLDTSPAETATGGGSSIQVQLLNWCQQLDYEVNRIINLKCMWAFFNWYFI